MTDLSHIQDLLMYTLAKIVEKSDIKKSDIEKMDKASHIVWESVKDKFASILKIENSDDTAYSSFLEERKMKLYKKYPKANKKEINIKFEKCIHNVEKKWMILDAEEIKEYEEKAIKKKKLEKKERKN